MGTSYRSRHWTSNSTSILLNEEEWKEMVKTSKNFDFEKYYEAMKNMHSSPEYIEWFNSKPDHVKEAFRSMPFEKFYTDKKRKSSIYRLYGVMEMVGGIRYHAVSAHIGWTNDVIGGLNPDDIFPIENWSENQLFQIRLNNVPEAFLMPDGWMIFMNEEAKEREK